MQDAAGSAWEPAPAFTPGLRCLGGAAGCGRIRIGRGEYHGASPTTPDRLRTMKHLAARTFALGSFLLVQHDGLAQSPLRDHVGDDAFDRLGWSANPAGDVDGDGIEDLIVGMPEDDNAGSNSGSARVLSGYDGSTIYTFDGDAVADRFGWSVDGAGDLNGDGFADVIVGARRADPEGVTSAGLARVFSGIDGSEMYTFVGEAASDFFGTFVTGVGDIDGDTVPDVMVGAPQDNTGSGGYVRFLSGQTGGTIRTLFGGTVNGQFGISGDAVGDVNGDGRADVVIGEWLAAGGGNLRGRAALYSGLDGSELLFWTGDADFEWCGWSVAGAGLVDGDALPDVIVGCYGAAPNGDTSGRARVFSGDDGMELLTIDGAAAGDNFGWNVDGAGDVNGDGRGDLIVGGPFSTNGKARLVSGLDGSPLLPLVGDDAGELFGREVSGGFDLNGDGTPDFMVGAPFASDNGTNAGRLRVYSGATLSLLGDEHLVSLASGGVQTLDLDAGAAFGGELYWILGTLSGTAPGLSGGGFVLPLNFDGYFLFTLTNPNLLIPASLALLDAQGTAATQLALPAGLDPGLAGATFHHAYAVVDVVGGATLFVSNPVSLHLVP